MTEPDDDLELRLAVGHPEEAEHQPRPFATVRAAASRRATASRERPPLRSIAVLAAAAVLAIVAVGTRLGGPGGLATPAGDRFSNEGGASPAAAGGAAPSSAAGRDTGTVDCQSVSAADCRAVVQALSSVTGAALDRVSVRQLADAACPLGATCAPEVATTRRYVATADALDGDRLTFLCDAAAGASCTAAAATEVDALATIVVRVDGAAARTIFLSAAGGQNWTAGTAEPTLERRLQAGRWRLLVSGGDCPDCGGRSPQFYNDALLSSDWCSVDLDVAPGSEVEAIVRVLSVTACRIDVR